MSWTDDELDNVFREAAEQPVFEYQASYFQDIEKQLPIQKSRKIAWYWWTATIFIIGFVSLFFTKVWTPELNGKNAQKKSEQSNDVSVAKANISEQKMNIPSKNTNSQTKQNIQFTANNTNVVVPSNKLKSSRAKTVLVNVDQPIKDVESIPAINAVGELDQIADVNEVTPSSEILSETETGLTFLSLSELQFEQSNRMNDPFRSFKMNKNSFYLGLNAGVEQAWSSVENVPSPFYSKVSVEFGFSRPIKSLNFSAGLAFEATKLNDLRIQERTKIYSFGSAILENSYQFSSIYSVLVPIEFSKAFGRHTIGFGAVGEVNLFAHASHEKSVDGVRTMDANGLTNVDLFNRYGLSPKLSYSLALSEKLQIGLSLQTQLLQPLNSDRFIGEATKLPISGQVFLKRALKF